MKKALSLLSLILSFSVLAEEKIDAAMWLTNLSQALKQQNFATSFVVVKNSQAVPYHWSHGINEAGEEVELLSQLNGPNRDIIRLNNIVSYIEPELPPYSINSRFINSPIPEIFFDDPSLLAKNYDVISVGRNRILGRPAQIIRIVARDQHRLGYWLWLDQETGLLLKMAVLDNNGQLIEQVQFTHLEFLETIPATLAQIEANKLPKIIQLPEGMPKVEHQWQVAWLPPGFELISSNTHRIFQTKQASEFMLFSDGLTDISVYVAPSQVNKREYQSALDGATIAANHVINHLEISVVGKIPNETAHQIANSITFKEQP